MKRTMSTVVLFVLLILTVAAIVKLGAKSTSALANPHQAVTNAVK